MTKKFNQTAEMSNTGLWSFEDELWERMSEPVFRKVHNDDQSIAWKFWHSTRIEDIKMNILIAGEPQILYSGSWLEKIGAAIHDTGNAMNEKEIEAFSNSIDMQALRDYRTAVGRKTRNVIKSLKAEDLKKRVEAERLKRIIDEGDRR